MTAAVCTKVQYSAKCVAETALLALFWPGVRRGMDRDYKPGQVMAVYECACGWWHLGHRTPANKIG